MANSLRCSLGLHSYPDLMLQRPPQTTTCKRCGRYFVPLPRRDRERMWREIYVILEATHDLPR